MIPWSSVQDWNAARLAAIADDMRNASKTLQAIVHEVPDAVTPRGWEGEASEAASTALGRLTERAHTLIETLDEVWQACDAAEQRVAGLLRSIDSANELAASHEFLIDKRGTIVSIAQPSPEGAMPSTEWRAQIMAELQQMVDYLRAETETIDDELNAKLRNVMSDADPTTMDGMRHGQSGAVSAEASPTGQALSGVEGHSGYFTEGSTSQHNMAAVVAGRRDLVVEGRNVDAGDLIRAGLDPYLPW